MIARGVGWLVGRFGLLATAAFVGGVGCIGYILFSGAPMPASVQARNKALVNCPAPVWTRPLLQKIGVLHVAGNTCKFLHW